MHFLSLAREREKRHFPDVSYPENRMPRDARSGRAKSSHPKGFDKRLRDLIKAHAPSRAAFAKRCGIDPQRLADWLNHKHPQMPSAAHLRAMCASTGVSLDWLLLGEGGAGPVYRGQSRTKAELAADLAAHVANDLRGRGLIRADASDEWVNGELLLANAVETAAESLHALMTAARVEHDAAELRVAAFILAKDDAPPEARAAARAALEKHPYDVALPPEVLATPPYVESPAMRKWREARGRRFAADGRLRPDVSSTLAADWSAAMQDSSSEPDHHDGRAVS